MVKHAQKLQHLPVFIWVENQPSNWIMSIVFLISLTATHELLYTHLKDLKQKSLKGGSKYSIR